MGKLLLYTMLASCMAAGFVRPWIGVVASYLIVILNPQNIWWWNFEGIRPIYWVLIPTLAGFAHGVLTGKYDLIVLKNRRNLYLAILWCMFALSYYVGPYVNIFGQYRFYDASSAFSVVNKIFLLYFVACCCIEQESKVKMLIGSLVISVCYLTYWANDQYLAGQQFGRIMGPGGLYGTGIHTDENGFALLFVIGIPFLYYLGFYYRKKLLRWSLWLVIPFAWHAIFLTGSRGGLLGLCATIVLAGFRSPKRIVGLLLIPAFVFAYFWQAGDVMKGRAETIGEYDSESSAVTRLEAWRAASNMICKYPFGGVGFASFGPAFSDHSDKRPREAHNTLLQISAESGVLAGAMHLFLVMACLAGLWKSSHRLRNGLKTEETRFLYLMNEAALVSFSGFVVCSIFLSLHGYEIFYYLCLVINSVLFLSKENVPIEATSTIYGNTIHEVENYVKCGLEVRNI